MSGHVWTVRPARTADAPALVDLFARAFGKTITVDHWMWKLGGHGTADLANVWVAVDGERIVFHYGGIPLRFSIGGVERVVMVVVDVMTDPDYRRRGILTDAGRRVHEHWRDAGVAFLAGLPNDQWGSRTSALGWTHAFDLQWLVCAVRPAALLANRVHVPVIGRLTGVDRIWNRLRKVGGTHDPLAWEQVPRADERFDALWRAAAGTWELSVVRDSRWINWRYVDSPDFEYQVCLAHRGGEAVGYAVDRIDARPGRAVGIIAELIACDDESVPPLLDAAVERLRRRGVDVVRTLAVPESPTHTACRRARFIARESFRGDVVPLDPQLPVDTLRNCRRWLVAGGDFDVV